MSLCKQFVLMAEYNQWMNARVYAAAGRLSREELARDRGAFFGSILGTLNHLVVADLIWLRRFMAHPARPALLDEVEGWPRPAALAQILFDQLDALRAQREPMDRLIRDWAGALRDADLDQALDYRNTQGVAARRPFSSLVLHFFNHQTHHRGQLSTLLTQAGQDVGVTDLLTLIPNHAQV